VETRSGTRPSWPRAAWAALALAVAPLDAGAEGERDLFTLRPSLATTLVIDDNPEHVEHGSDSSVGAWVRPRFEVGYHAPRLELGADLGADLRRYSGYDSSLSDEFARVRGWAEVELAPGLGLRVADAWIPRATRLGRPEDDGSNLVQTNHLEGRLRHWRALPGERELEIGVVGEHFTGEDFSEPLGGGVVDDDFQATHAGGLGYLEIQTPLVGRTTAFLRGQGGYRALEDAPDADHAHVGGSLGLRIPIGDGSSLELAGGGGWLGFAGLEDRPRALGRVALRLDLPGGFASTLSATHRLTASLEGRKVVETDARIEVERYFGRRMAVAVALFGTRFDSGSLPSVDLFGGGEGRVRYQLTRWSQIVARYRHWTNGGDYGADDFAQNRVTLELRFQPSVL
jgi:hypothetical protein